MAETKLYEILSTMIATESKIVSKVSGIILSGDGSKYLKDDGTYSEINDIDTSNLLNKSLSGVSGGIATLDSTGKIPSGQIPDLEDEINYLTFRAPIIKSNETTRLNIEFSATSGFSSVTSYTMSGNATMFSVFDGTTWTTVAITGLQPAYSENEVLFALNDTIKDNYTYYRWSWYDKEGTKGRTGSSRLDSQSLHFDVDTITESEVNTLIENSIANGFIEDFDSNDVEYTDGFDSDDNGKLYRYTGTTDSTYVSGAIYYIKDATAYKVLLSGDIAATSFANITGSPSDNESLSAVLSAKMDAPKNSGSAGQVLTKTSTGYEWQTTEIGESGTTINNLCFKAPTISADKYAKLIIDFKNDSDNTVSSINSYSNSSLFKAFNGSTFVTTGVLNNNYSEKQVLVDISTLTVSATWFAYRWDGCTSIGTSNSTGETGASRLDAASQLFDSDSSGISQADLTEALTDYATTGYVDTKLDDYALADDIPNGIETFDSSSKSFASTDVGKIFEYNGETSGKFVNGKYYGVFAKTTTTQTGYIVTGAGTSANVNGTYIADGTTYTGYTETETETYYSNGNGYYIVKRYIYAGADGDYYKWLITNSLSNISVLDSGVVAYSSGSDLSTATWIKNSSDDTSMTVTYSAGGSSTTYTAVPLSIDQTPVDEESASSTYTVYPGRNVQLTCTGNVTLAADGGVAGFWGSAEIDIISGSYGVSEGTNLTFVDSPTTNVTNHCVIRWRGTSARLYVVDTE